MISISSEPSQIDIQSVSHCLNEIGGLHELGAVAEARQLGEDFLLHCDSPDVRTAVMAMAMRADDLSTAFRHSLYLSEKFPDHAVREPLVPIVLNYAGHLEAAYRITKDRVSRDEDYCSLYALACRAWPLGRLEEAFRALLKSLNLSGNSRWNASRKAFLDVELRPVFEYAATRPVTPADALRWAHFYLEAILRFNRDPLPTRSIDFADLPLLPEELHCLLQPRSPNTKGVDPLRARRFPDLFHQYLVWENQQCRPQVLAFAHWAERLRACYDEMLPEMARFCAARGRAGTGRYLIRQYLARHPETNPMDFPDIPGLEYWIEEWRRLWQIHPDATCLLIVRRPGADSKSFCDDVFSQIPEALRESGLGAMVLGTEQRFQGRHEEALETYRQAVRHWGTDNAVIHNIITTLATLKRWDEAAQVCAHPDFCRHDPDWAAYVREAIANKQANVFPPIKYVDSPYPTPSFACLDNFEDRLFLRHYRTMQRRG